MWWLRFVKADKASYICSQIQWKMKLIANSPFFFNHWSNLFYLQTPYELHLNDVKLWDMLILHLFFNLTNDGWLLLKREILVCRWYYLLPWESRSEVINLFFFYLFVTFLFLLFAISFPVNCFSQSASVELFRVHWQPPKIPGKQGGYFWSYFNFLIM